MNEQRVALTAPVAERSWEALTVLERTTTDGVAVRVTFPFECEIIGIYPSISQASNVGGGRKVPGLDDVIVSLSMNTDTNYTSRFSEQNAQSQSAEVTLGSFKDSTGGARSMSIVAGKSGTGVVQNEVVATFKWKVAAVANAVFEDAAVGLCFLIRKVRT